MEGSFQHDEDRCFSCDEPAKLECPQCKTWRFCSKDCGKMYDDVHLAVCHNLSNNDPAYVESQLEKTVLDMMENVDSRYTDKDISDAIEVLAAFHPDAKLSSVTIGHAIEEAHEIIDEHLHDHGGAAAFDEMHPDIQTSIANTHPTYKHHHLTNVAFDRIANANDEEMRWKADMRREMLENKKRPSLRYRAEKKAKRRMRRREARRRRKERKAMKAAKKMEEMREEKSFSF